jgi:periplasmic protein TonB
MATTIAPFYRLYELPWSPTQEVEERFRRYVRNVGIVFLILGLLIPFLPKVERSQSSAPVVPERVLKLVVEKKLPPPPPPPPPKEEPKPEPVAEKAPPKPKPKEDARQQASKALAVFDQLADLRDQSVIDKAQIKDLKSAAEETRSERSLITSKVGVNSGGINTAGMSRGYGGSSGALSDRELTKVGSTLGSQDGRSQVRRTSGSGKGARSREEVELTFDRNKGAIYALYSRALRDLPDLRGKVVLEITISPTGEVTNCRVLSSELNNADLERKLVARVKLFRFEARDVEAITLTKPIDFFPAG